MEISVVLVTCDRARAMRGAVKSLFAQRLDSSWTYELVVVDDGSSDETAAVLEELRGRSPVPMRVLRTGGVGVPGARNAGAHLAAGRWMACFDDDQIAAPCWLQELRQTAEATCSRCVGGALTLRVPEGAPTNLGRRARALLGEHLLSTKVCPYRGKWLPASNNVLIERELFFALGGFDERFVQGGSDTDLFRRVRETGEALWFAPGARAEHVLAAQRFQPDALRWTSRKVGAASARILTQRRSVFARLGAAAVRCGLAVMRDLPALAFRRITGNASGVLESCCSLWYTEGLLRGLMAGWAPRLFGGVRFLERLDFRRHNGERQTAQRRMDVASPACRRF